MKFWQSLAFVEMEQMIELAQFCEELGFHGVSYGDHLVTTSEQVDEYLYRDNGNVFWNPDTHWPDPWVVTAALAQATTRLEFLSTIYILPMRDPLTAAKMVNYSDAFSAYLPCRIALVEDNEGQLWLYTLNMDMMIHGGTELPDELYEEATNVKEIILDIMNRGAAGEF